MGNTAERIENMTFNEDHPHIHGEYDWLTTLNNNSAGSPPHTWGIPGQIGAGLRHGRITPTYMGNTLLTIVLSTVFQDHPHIHGEYFPCHFKRTSDVGSPPHTWGITYMGNTSTNYAITQPSKDHPHIHGEYSPTA